MTWVLDPRREPEPYWSNSYESKYSNVYEEEVCAFNEAHYAYIIEVGDEEWDHNGQLPTYLASVLAIEGSRMGTVSF